MNALTDIELDALIETLWEVSPCQEEEAGEEEGIDWADVDAYYAYEYWQEHQYCY
jgi:hypothetical protein